MLLANYKVVAFDAVGTLLHPQPSGVEIYAAVGRRYGSRYGVAEVAQRFAAAWAYEEEMDRAAGWRTSPAREWQRWRRIVSTVLDDVTDCEGCFAELYEHFSRPQAWCLAPQTAWLLEQLAEQGCRLALASNYDYRLRQVVAGLPSFSCFEHLVISAEVGWRKPAAAFFTALADTCQVPPAQVVYIGDDPINDCQATVNAGLGTVLFDPSGKGPAWSGHKIRQLPELLGLAKNYSR